MTADEVKARWERPTGETTGLYSTSRWFGRHAVRASLHLKLLHAGSGSVKCEENGRIEKVLYFHV